MKGEGCTYTKVGTLTGGKALGTNLSAWKTYMKIWSQTAKWKNLPFFSFSPPHPSQHTSEALKPVEKMPKSRIKRAVFAPEVCLHSRRSAGVGRLASLCVLHLANRAQKSGADHAGDQSTESRVLTCASAALCCLSCPD